VITTYVDDDPLAKVMIVRYGLEVCDACILGVGIRPILVLAAEFRQRSAIIKIAMSLITCLITGSMDDYAATLSESDIE